MGGEVSFPRKFGNVIFKGNCKSCIEALRDGGVAVPWRIKNFVADVRLQFGRFANASFSWVNCEVNKVAHSLVRWPMLNSVFGSFDLGNSPFAFVNVILKEACQ